MDEEAAALSVGPGWAPIIRAFYMTITHNQHLYSNVQVLQVKEKFGGLRIYFIGGDLRLRGYVDGLAAASYYICEYCGRAGFLREDLGWVKTLCDGCYKEKLHAYHTT